MKVGVIGSGIVGQTLADGFLKHGHEVMRGSRDAATRAARRETPKSRVFHGWGCGVHAHPRVPRRSHPIPTASHVEPPAHRRARLPKNRPTRGGARRTP